MYRVYRKMKKTQNMRKKNKTRKILRGGNSQYEINYCSDSKNVFITLKNNSKTFNKFKPDGFNNDNYDLKKIIDPNLFEILSDAKRNDQNFDNLLIRYGVNDIDYYPYAPYYSSQGKIYKTKKYNQRLRKIEEIDEDVSEQSDKNSPRRNRRKESIFAAMQFADVASSTTGSKKLRVTPKKRSTSTNIAAPVLRLPSRLPSNHKQPPFKP
jgi:hypothetical protein